jgi:YidC/Oxa1 family membrane protein insertase
MSQPASPRGSFIQTMLFAAVIVLAFNIFTNSRSQNDDRTAEQIMQAVRSQAADVKAEAQKRSIPISQVLTERAPRDLKASHGKLSVEQTLEQMRLQNELVMDLSLAANLGNLDAKINARKELAATDPNRFDEAAAITAKLEGHLLTADAQQIAAIQRQDINKIIPAFDALVGLSREHSDEAVWKQPFRIPAHPLMPRDSISAEGLKAEVSATSSRLGMDTPVWGFFPGYQFIDAFVRLTGSVPSVSYALACLLLALIVRGIVFPLAQRQMMWGRQMAQLSPLVNEIKDQYKDKPQKAQEMNVKVMELYKEYGINPMAGCGPAFLQLPLFLLVYQSMLHYRFEFQKGTFLWINPSLGEQSNGLIAANLGQKDYILIVLYGISMITTTLLTPVSDPSNARQQRIMGLSIAVLFSIMMFFWPVPSAFVLYWVFTNVLATAQSLRAYRLPLPPLVKKNAPNGGVIPIDPSNGKLNGKKESTGAPKRYKPKKKK